MNLHPLFCRCPLCRTAHSASTGREYGADKTGEPHIPASPATGDASLRRLEAAAATASGDIPPLGGGAISLIDEIARASRERQRRGARAITDHARKFPVMLECRQIPVVELSVTGAAFEYASMQRGANEHGDTELVIRLRLKCDHPSHGVDDTHG